MSLLLDALKRAEQEKVARPGIEAPAPAEPASAAGAARKPRLELESVEPVSALAQPARDDEREGAKAVFAAKQAEAGVTATSASGRKVIATIGGVAAVILLAGAAYVWYEISRPMAPMPRVTRPGPAPAATGGQPQASPATVPDAATDTAPISPMTPVAAAPVTNAGPAATPPPSPRKAAADKVVASVLSEAAKEPGATAVAIAPAAEPPSVPAEIRGGFEALRRGDIAIARAQYEAAIVANPSSLDGHLGLATAAAAAGDRASAARHYRRALSLDPRNPTALAGLAALEDFSRAEGTEARLRSEIAHSPQSAALHFTLGSLFAAQGRWTEAQAAFFEAHRLDPDSADIAYNLAVSLDHLGKTKIAEDFYGRALAAARQGGASFDRAEVARRIAELKR